MGEQGREIFVHLHEGVPLLIRDLDGGQASQNGVIARGSKVGRTAIGVHRGAVDPTAAERGTIGRNLGERVGCRMHAEQRDARGQEGGERRMGRNPALTLGRIDRVATASCVHHKEVGSSKVRDGVGLGWHDLNRESSLAQHLSNALRGLGIGMPGVAVSTNSG